MFNVVDELGKYFIKFAGGQLIIRVGGGWDSFKRWLEAHDYSLGDGDAQDTAMAKEAKYSDVQAAVARGGGAVKGQELGKRRKAGRGSTRI